MSEESNYDDPQYVDECLDIFVKKLKQYLKDHPLEENWDRPEHRDRYHCDMVIAAMGGNYAEGSEEEVAIKAMLLWHTRGHRSDKKQY